MNAELNNIVLYNLTARYVNKTVLQIIAASGIEISYPRSNLHWNVAVTFTALSVMD